MIRPIVCLLAAISALEPAAALAAPGTPCDRVEAPAVAGLADRLARSDDPDAWLGLMPAAAEAAAATDTLGPADRACAAYVAGSAAFFLSAERGVRRRFAAAAVAHFARAEVLAPDGMSGRQPRSRLRAAWERLGEVPGWLRGRRPVALAIPPGPVGALRITPADPPAWAAVCADERCPVAIEVPRAADGGSVSLRPGWYRVAHVGPCGTNEQAVEVDGGLLPVPDPAICTARISAVDGAEPVADFTVRGPEPVDPAAAPVEVPLTVEAPGYQPRTITAPAAGGPLSVALERCPVTLEVDTRPSEARVEGDGPGPWGRRTVRATAPGHGPVEETIEVPRPAGCAGRHRLAIELPRPVSVVATDAEGRPVSIARLVVQGEPVDPVGLYRISGRYGLQAMHPTLGAVTAKFEVSPCDGPDCGPVVVPVRFSPLPSAGPGAGPTVAYVTGGVLLGISALAGLSAWGTHGEILSYESKRASGRGIDELVDERDRAALTADVLFVGGGLSLLTGWLWSKLSEGE